ncbi:Syntaxin-binding protein [Thalictrum thalictroides]|uniref:Syntaxin-binding protein n=1 Tax=Thalictrum thalictroides TaxID=46969 RepID=A0A7J6VTG9_THATH|nr:Syntaxin-binding protein [Thalictrum thalictroides]
MSMSDSDSSSHGGEYKNFRQISRDRLLHEMLRSTKTGESKSWKVLIMDKITVKVISCSCKMADITDEGVSLVEDLFRRRQPLPSMDAIYFMQPSRENVVMFLSDMSGRVPLYKKAFIFFSSPVPKELVSLIKNDTSVLPRIGALREMNLEYFAIDSQGFITDNERALEELFGENVENSRHYDVCLNVMASRIATVFASLRELPFVRYRSAKNLDASTVTTLRDVVPTKLAASIWNCLTKYKTTIPHFPQTETCELLILDRSVDQIAPVIHEWTYDAMCHDLLDMEGNKYVHEIASKTGGEPEKKEVLLEDHDPIWLELRHAHIADASERLHEKMTNFVSKNKAAQIQGSRNGSELSTRDLQKMVQALPQYSEQIDKLSLHVEIAGKINRIIREMDLRELGQLEQDLVFGDAGTKEVINFLRTKQHASPESKLRLLMIYAAVSPEKFEGDKGSKLMQLARLSPDDMNAVHNMRLLEGSSDAKKNSAGSFSLKFDVNKRKHAARKDRTGEEETWQLSRFYPMIEELVEKLGKGELPKNDYPCMNDPSPTVHGTTQSAPVRNNQVPTAHSMRSRRTATWARPRNSDDGYSSDSVLRHTSSDFKRMGQRIFVFIIGGATRSELRVCHKLTTKLKREVILGSSSLDDPPQFITKLKLLSAQELSIDDLRI